MSMVSINWHPSPKEMRKFGLVVIIGLCLIGLVFHLYFDNQGSAVYLYIAAGILGLPGLTGTAVGLPGYWLWMGIAFVMGNIMSRVILTIIYYLLITPMGLVRRLFGNDALCLQKKAVDTYWKDLRPSPKDAKRYERQF